MKNSFYNMLKKNAEERPDSIAIVYDTITISYAELFEDVKKKALHLQKFEGNRIAIFGPSSYRWIVNMFGILLAGKDLVLIDFFLPQDARKELLLKTKVDYTLTSTNQYILSDAGANIIAKAEKDDVSGLVYDDATKEGNIILLTATADEDDKPVALSTANICHTAELMRGRVECSPEDIVLSQISLHHIFGYIYSLIWPLSCGAKVCIGRGLRHIDADTYYYSPTILPVTPSMVDYLRRVNGFNPCLEKVIVGAASCPFRIFENLNDRDLEVYNIYGMTEVSAGIGVNNHYDGSYTLFDEEAVSIAEDGEILVRGNGVMSGYVGDEAGTKEVLIDGVYHTGDYGHINSKGRLVLEKRNPDIVLLPTGEKISRKRTNEQITALNGVAEGYITFYDNKLTAIIVPLDSSEGMDKFKRRIDKYNEKKGYRWEIQKIVVLDKPLPKNAENVVDDEAIIDILIEKK